MVPVFLAGGRPVRNIDEWHRGVRHVEAEAGVLRVEAHVIHSAEVGPVDTVALKEGLIEALAILGLFDAVTMISRRKKSRRKARKN